MYPIKLFLRKPEISIPLVVGGLVHVAIWLILFFLFPPTSDTVFLHYNILFGVDLVGQWTQLLRLPIIGLCILVVHTIVGWLSYQYDWFLATVFVSFAALSQIFLFLSMYMIIYINS